MRISLLPPHPPRNELCPTPSIPSPAEASTAARPTWRPTPEPRATPLARFRSPATSTGELRLSAPLRTSRSTSPKTACPPPLSRPSASSRALLPLSTCAMAWVSYYSLPFIDAYLLLAIERHSLTSCSLFRPQGRTGYPAGCQGSRRRQAPRPLPPRRLADRLRHPVQHERQRGHLQPSH